MVGQLPMNQPRPDAHRVVPKSELLMRQPIKFGEDDMDRDDICIKTIDPRGKHQIELELSELQVPPTSYMIGCKEPDITREVRAGKARDAMPNNLGKVHIRDHGAVEVNFVT